MTEGSHAVPGFHHRPGRHCGSTALRNLLAFHGVEISEAMAFGLGAGACFYYVPLPDSPWRFINGRAGRLEESFAELTGLPLVLETAEDPDEAWERAREVVDAGRPVLLLTDLYELDYYGRSARFPGHAVVLFGYDEEHAVLADTAFELPQRTTLESLRAARWGDHVLFPLRGHMMSVPEGAQPSDPGPAAGAAIARAARGMLEPELGEYQGVPALHRLEAEIAGWPEEVEDARWCARFTYQVIERRGTGGANFRRMYAEFLEEAGYGEAGLAAATAERWTELATGLLEVSEDEEPDPGRWARIGVQAGRVREAEERLWTALDGRG